MNRRTYLLCSPNEGFIFPSSGLEELNMGEEEAEKQTLEMATILECHSI